MAEISGKIAIIGAGRIGSLCAWSLAMRGIGSEIVLVDIDRPKGKAQATDMSDASMHFTNNVRIISGGYAECAGAGVALICVGVRPQEAGRGHLAETARVLSRVAEDLAHSGFSGVAVVASHPNDILTRCFQQAGGFPAKKVIGAQAMVCTLRLRRMLSERFRVDQGKVEIYAIGECGESQTVAWSAAKVDGQPLLKLMEQFPETYGRIDLSDVAGKSRRLGWVIEDGKGREEFGITCAACLIAMAVLEDSRSVLPVSVSLDGAYGQRELYASTPAVIGREGVVRVLEVSMNAGEQAEFAASCLALRDQYREIAMCAHKK